MADAESKSGSAKGAKARSSSKSRSQSQSHSAAHVSPPGAHKAGTGGEAGGDAWPRPSFVALAAAQGDSERLEFIAKLDALLQRANADYADHPEQRAGKAHEQVAKFARHFGATLPAAVRQCVAAMQCHSADVCEHIAAMLNDVCAFVWANQKEKLPATMSAESRGLLQLIELNSSAGIGLLQPIMHPGCKASLAAPVLSAAAGNLCTLVMSVEHTCAKVLGAGGDECECAERFGPLHAAAEIALLVAAARHCPSTVKSHFNALSKQYDGRKSLQYIVCLNHLYPEAVEKPIEHRVPYLLDVATSENKSAKSDGKEDENAGEATALVIGPALLILSPPASLSECSVLSLHVMHAISKRTPAAFDCAKCTGATARLEAVFVAGRLPAAGMALELIKTLVCHDAKKHTAGCKLHTYYETACRHLLPPRSLQIVTDMHIQCVVQDTPSAGQCVNSMAQMLRTPAFPPNGKVYILQAWTELAERHKQACTLKKSSAAKSALEEVSGQGNVQIAALATDLLAALEGGRPKTEGRAKSAGGHSLLFDDSHSTDAHAPAAHVASDDKAQSQACLII